MKKAYIENEDGKFLGYVDLREEELNHFSATGSVPAKVALDSAQIAAFGPDDEDYIFIREVA